MHLWPQITILALIAIGVGSSLADFGKPKTGTNGWTELLIAPAITLTILYCGGFFTPMGF